MKALSIVRPGGTRIAEQLKTIEVRSWRPDIDPNEDLLIVENDRFLRADDDKDSDGRAVAIVRVARVRPFLRKDMIAACASSFAEGWLAWELTDMRDSFERRRTCGASHLRSR
jgi:hypothetical protein